MQAHINITRPEPKDRSLISPVPQLLQNNIPPTEDETQRIREIILIAQNEETRLKTFAGEAPECTNSTQGAINRESQKLRQDVQDFIHIHERLLSPLLRFPTELLALIFVHCVPNLETPWDIRRPTWKDHPFLLSQVCQRWRFIALDTPQLWTVLGVVNVAAPLPSLRSKHQNGSKISLGSKNPIGYLNFLWDILNHSKDEGLCLWLYNSSEFGYEPVHNDIMDILAKQAHRITALVIQSGTTTLNEFCAASHALRSESRSTTFARLQKLVLDLREYPFGAPIDGFAHAPALRDVTIRGVHPVHLSLPWAQLRAYSETARVRTNSRGNLDTVLSLAQGLERLDVANLEYNISPRSFYTMDNFQRILTPIKLTNVRLYFPREYHRDQSIKALLTHFHYPAVQELWIDSRFYDILKTFLTMADNRYPQFARPFTYLTKLYYRSEVYNPSSFIEFLRLTPNLEELDVKLPPNIQTLVYIFSTRRSVHPASRHSCLAPALKQLFVHCNISRQNEYAQKALYFLRNATEICLNNLHRNPFPHIRLIFDDGDFSIVRKAEAYLNHDITSSSGRFAIPKLLSKWRNDLQTEIPSLRFTHTIRQVSSSNELRFSVTRFNAILTNIEKHKLTPEQMRQLYISGLHLSLDRLTCLPDAFLPGNSKHQFRARARKILEQWEPLHRADLCSPKTQTLWVVKGMRSLVFIPPNDALRTGPDAMRLIYGLDDD